MQISNKDELNAAVVRAQARGIATEELASLSMRIAQKYLLTDKFKGYSEEEREDILGMWTIRFMRDWTKLDPTKNCFSYITRSVTLAWKDYARSTARRLRREHANAEAAFYEERDRLSRFIRSYERELGEQADVLSVREYTDKIKSRHASGVDTHEDV